MKENEVKEYIKQSMIDNINSVLDGKTEIVELLYVRPYDVISYMESIGGLYEEGIETNGWEWDYWFTIEYKDKKFSCCGDGYYRNTASFSSK